MPTPTIVVQSDSNGTTINTLPPTGAATSANSLPFVPATDSTFTIVRPDVTSSGTIASATSNAAFTTALANGQGIIGYALTGLTASGATLTAEASNDGGATWAAINLVSPVTGALSTTASADGNYRINAGGHTNIRLRVSTTGTGSITVAAVVSSQNPLVALSAPVTLAGSSTPISTTVRSTGTNRSASVTTTAANLMAANTARQGWKIKNDSTVTIYINFDATATAAAGSGNFAIPAGGYLASEPGFVETGAMSAIAASGSANVTAREH